MSGLRLLPVLVLVALFTAAAGADEKAKPASPEKAKPASPEKAKPASPEKAKPASPEKAKPASPEKAKIASYPMGKPGVWATVDGHEILKKDAVELFEKARKSVPLEIVLDGLILERVYITHLDREKVEVPQADIDRAFKDALPHLRKQGLTDEQIRSKVVLRVRLFKAVDKRATDAAVEAYFNENRERYVGQIRVARILVDQGKDSRANAEARARAIIARILKGESFTEICRAESDDRLAPFDGGDLGWIIPDGFRLDPVIRAARSLKVGGVSKEPIYHRHGFHIVKVTGQRTPALSFADFRRKDEVRQAFKLKTMKHIQLDWVKRSRVQRYLGAPAPSSLYPSEDKKG